jgi:hypothetical protein
MIAISLIQGRKQTEHCGVVCRKNCHVRPAACTDNSTRWNNRHIVQVCCSKPVDLCLPADRFATYFMLTAVMWEGGHAPGIMAIAASHLTPDKGSVRLQD